MRSHQTEYSIQPSAGSFIDITDKVEAALRESAVRSGRVTVFASDEDSRLVVNERESGLMADMERVLRKLGPEKSRALVGSASVTLPIEAGKLHLGTWQRILLVLFPSSGRSASTVILEVVGS
ncbi:MAG TPA: YjbQ family protein [Actinomycetota bacterium]|nr:YjbQ family protein [Actinomycetota bacterium]